MPPKNNIHTNQRLTQQKKKEEKIGHKMYTYSAKYVQIIEPSVGVKAACRLRAHILYIPLLHVKRYQRHLYA